MASLPDCGWGNDTGVCKLDPSSFRKIIDGIEISFAAQLGLISSVFGVQSELPEEFRTSAEEAIRIFSGAVTEFRGNLCRAASSSAFAISPEDTQLESYNVTSWGRGDGRGACMMPPGTRLAPSNTWPRRPASDKDPAPERASERLPDASSTEDVIRGSNSRSVCFSGTRFESTGGDSLQEGPEDEGTYMKGLRDALERAAGHPGDSAVPDCRDDASTVKWLTGSQDRLAVQPGVSDRKDESLESREVVAYHTKSSLSKWLKRTSKRKLNSARPVHDRDNADLLKGDGELSDAGLLVHGVLNPNYPGRMFWDFLIIFVVIVDATVLPFQICFAGGNEAFDQVWVGLTTTFFVTDILASFTTGYTAGEHDEEFEYGALVTRYRDIARQYMRTWFFVDVISTVPWALVADILGGGKSSQGGARLAKLSKIIKFVRFLRLMRMLRLVKLGVIWDRVEAKMGSILFVQLLGLIRILLIIVAVCHWNACIWWIIGQRESLLTDLMSSERLLAWQEMDHWTTVWRSNGADGELFRWADKPSSEAYVFCFYWTLGVMRTMPSEVQPTNLSERVYVLVFMMFAVVVFAITITMITQASVKLTERRRVFNEDMAHVRFHFRRIQAKEPLQANIKNYLKHLYDRRRIGAKEANLFQLLPGGLSTRLKWAGMEAYVRYLEVSKSLTVQGVLQICELCEVQDMLPNEIVAKRGDVAKAAYIVVAGRLQATDCDFSKKSHIRKVDEECLQTPAEVSSVCTVKVVTVTEVLRIDKTEFFAQFTLEHCRGRGDIQANHDVIALSQQTLAAQALHSNHGRFMRTSTPTDDSENKTALAVVQSTAAAVSS